MVAAWAWEVGFTRQQAFTRGHEDEERVGKFRVRTGRESQCRREASASAAGDFSYTHLDSFGC